MISRRPIGKLVSYPNNNPRSAAERWMGGALAPTLAAVGLYGVFSYGVAERGPRDRHPDGARCRRWPPRPSTRRGYPQARACRQRTRLALAVSATRLPGGLLFRIDAPGPLTSLGVPLVLGVAAFRIDCAPPPTWSRYARRVTRQASAPPESTSCRRPSATPMLGTARSRACVARMRQQLRACPGGSTDRQRPPELTAKVTAYGAEIDVIAGSHRKPRSAISLAKRPIRTLMDTAGTA